ncbi:MAG: hemolysin family protein, partial [Candidatus Margulisbacteria bacterium]|nr:hemolysin family protein [Candidatus Margulisiibacteriota bacterium]
MTEILLLIIFIALSAFFSASETAMTTISRPKIAQLVEAKRPGARTLRKLREDPAKLLSTILIGNNVVNISASVLATTVITGYFEKLGMADVGVIIGAAIGFMTLFLLVFGEITPKTVAIRNAETWALWLAPPMLAIEWVLTPVAWLLSLISRPFIFIFGGKLTEQGPFISEEEIKALLFIGEKEGVIEREEREMISSVFKFGDLTAREVMTGRSKMICVEAQASIEETVAKIKESGHSRLPVYDQNFDNIIGVVYAKDLLTADRSDKLNDHLRQALFIPGGKKISDVMGQMQAEYKHLAIVVDEFGHTLGLVTLEDLVEEIVGEIHDEYERR